ncbi:MAG TPA: ABC transporter permease [Gemmatimonadales bacterium]|jgi:putative ABC transport system permease protein
MSTFLNDLRYAARSLRRSPGFVVAAVITLALGIGANSAIFSVVNTVLLQPLPYPDPDRLMMIWESNSYRHRETNVVNPQNYLDWNDRAKSFTGLAALSWSSLTFTGEAAEIVQGRAVTANFFDVVGTPMALGRSFTAAEALPGGPPVIVLSDGLWRRRFGADPGIVGRPVPVAGGSATVLGVAPPALGPMPWGEEEYWEPFRLDPADRASRGGRYLLVVGRLKPGVSREQAQSEMTGISAALEREFPDFNTNWSSNVVSLKEQVVGSSRQVLYLLLGAVGMVLLIACANVGNLMLGRASGRRREMAIRTALGASRGRVVRQSLLESVLLALIGGAVGLLLASWAVDLLVSSGPPSIPRLSEIGVDPRVFALTAVTSLIVGILFGLPTALGNADSDLAAGLRSENTRTTSGRSATQFRAGLVVVQMSLALVLLAGAGLLVRSLQRLSAVDPGFDPRDLLTVAVDLPEATYGDTVRQIVFFEQLSERVRQIPGVQDVGAVNFLPLTPQGSRTSIHLLDRPEPPQGQANTADIRYADPSYFTTMRIPLQRGRSLNAADRIGRPPVVLINETMARQFWPGQNPIGQRLKIDMWKPDDQVEVVGVVGDLHPTALDDVILPMVYYPLSQEPSRSRTLVIRHAGDVTGLATQLRATVHQIDPDVPLTDVATMFTRLSQSMSDRRYPMLLLAGFAILAVILAAVGTYGVLSYAVGQRTREIGVRMALGARAQDVLGMVLGGGMRLALIGVVIGAVGAVFAARALGHLLYGTTPTDPVTFAAVAALLIVIAAAASYLPARRATRVDPMEALRSE